MTTQETPSWWHPSRMSASAREVCKLSPEEVLLVKSRGPDPVGDWMYADGVFEGGGVKGFAYLGAIHCFDQAGYKFRKTAGTSAGCLPAVFLAAGVSMDRLTDALCSLDFMELLKDPAPGVRLWLLGKDPSTYLNKAVRMVGTIMMSRSNGLFKTQALRDWAHSVLPDNYKTFPAAGSVAPGTPWHEQRSVQVICSDITSGAMRVLPDDLPTAYGLKPEEFPVADAIVCSMSIPAFFVSGRIGAADIVDGGLLSNFPVWLFDAPPGVAPKCPTFGFQLDEVKEGGKVKDPVPASEEGVVSYLMRLALTMLDKGGAAHRRKEDASRSMTIKVHVGTTEFNITNEQKEAMYVSGYKTAKTFLLGARTDPAAAAGLQHQLNANTEDGVLSASVVQAAVSDEAVLSQLVGGFDFRKNIAQRGVVQRQME